MIFYAAALIFVACAVMALAAQNRRRASLEAWNLASAVSATALVLICVMAGQRAGAGILALPAAFRWWIWRQGPRKRRRRSLKALGNKARARLAAMLRSMPKPGPVLRPVPQGARA